jgi:hypothetical protein
VTVPRTAKREAEPFSFSRLRLTDGDAIYNGGIAEWVLGLRPRNRLRLEIISKRPGAKKFKLLKFRWRVERTVAWLGRWPAAEKREQALQSSIEHRRGVDSCREGMIEGFTLGSYLPPVDYTDRPIREGKATISREVAEMEEPGWRLTRAMIPCARVQIIIAKYGRQRFHSKVGLALQADLR